MNTEATRQHFAQNFRDCIAGAVSGEFRVNDLQAYVAWQESEIAAVLAGDYDHTLTFRQRAHYLATGESIPLIAPSR